MYSGPWGHDLTPKQQQHTLCLCTAFHAELLRRGNGGLINKLFTILTGPSSTMEAFSSCYQKYSCSVLRKATRDHYHGLAVWHGLVDRAHRCCVSALRFCAPRRPFRRGGGAQSPGYLCNTCGPDPANRTKGPNCSKCPSLKANSM